MYFTTEVRIRPWDTRNRGLLFCCTGCVSWYELSSAKLSEWQWFGSIGLLFVPWFSLRCGWQTMTNYFSELCSLLTNELIVTGTSHCSLSADAATAVQPQQAAFCCQCLSSSFLCKASQFTPGSSGSILWAERSLCRTKGSCESAVSPKRYHQQLRWAPLNILSLCTTKARTGTTLPPYMCDGPWWKADPWTCPQQGDKLRKGVWHCVVLRNPSCPSSCWI